MNRQIEGREAMDPGIARIVSAVLGYALGCFSTGYYLSRRWRGLDPRGLGTGSSGARNVGRLMGRRGFAVTAAGDVAKGALAPLVATGVGAADGGMALASVAVVIGHVWPAQLGFRGGRGLTPALGAMLVLAWPVATVTCLVAAGLVKVLGRATWAAVVAVGLSPVIAVVTGQPAMVIAAAAVIAVVIAVTHRSHAAEMASALIGQVASRRAG